MTVSLDRLEQLLRAAREGDGRSARLLVHALAELVEDGRPIPNAALRAYAGLALRSCAFASPLPELAPPAKRARRPRASAELASTATTRGRRIAALLRMLELAGATPSQAVATLCNACPSVKRASAWAFKREWLSRVGTDGALTPADRARLMSAATGPELESLRRARDPHSKKLRAFFLD